MIKLQMFFQVDPEKSKDFERNYTDSYVPALGKQDGYIGSKLLRLFPDEVAREISAAETEYNYQMELIFDTEENRRKWVKSEEHIIAWPLAIAFVKSYAWRGYDVVGMDQVSPLLSEDPNRNRRDS